MKIINRGKKVKPEWPKQGTCRSCRTKVEVQKKDCQNIHDFRENDGVDWMVDCPNCGDHIYFGEYPRMTCNIFSKPT